MPLIDPLRLAQFMVLPGASELVEAFSAIPPGPVRDSVVSHAQVLAQVSGWNPATQPIIAREIAPPPKLESPFAENLHASTVEGRIVERALRGESDHAIAADMGLELGVVVRLKRKARNEGGVVFPGDEKAAEDKAKLKAKRKSLAPGERLNKAGRRIPALLPAPPGPWWWEDPKSPVWDNPSLLPSHVKAPHGSMAGIGPHSSIVFHTMERTAKRRGMTMREYIAFRRDIVRRAEAGDSPTKIAYDLHLTGYEVYGLLDKVGMARSKRPAAEHTIWGPKSLDAAETPPAAPPGTRVEAMQRIMRAKAAKKWGFSSTEAFEDARVTVKNMRMQGVSTTKIAERTRWSILFVGAAIEFWRKQGVIWPPKLEAA